MDPFTVLSVAAAAAQFAELSFKITKRIAKYAARSIELPPELVTINHRLKALQGCVSSIETRLRNAERDSSVDPGRLRDLKGFIEDITKRYAKLDGLFARYLPDDEDTRVDRIKKGFQSMSKDDDIKVLADGMGHDSAILSLSLSTLNLGSTAPRRNHRQPQGNQVITLVPNDRRVHDPVVRQDIIDQISRAFDASANDEPRVAILQGMGGQGKTQMALEYCRQSKRDLKFNGIFWVDASDESLASRTFAEIARKLSPEHMFADDESRVRFVKDALESWTLRWLLIFDNYDDPTSYAIQRFFPASSLGHVFITTRSPALSPLGQFVELHGMTLEESKRLLFSQCMIERTKDTEEHATAIIERLGFLPLAIAQAGAYLGEMRDTMQMSEFLTLYEEHMKDVLSTTPQVWKYVEHSSSSEQQNHVKSVFTTWDLTMRLLDKTQHAEEKRDFLSVMTLFFISDISEMLFESYWKNCINDRPSWLKLFEENGAWSTHRYARIMIEFKRLSLISTIVRNEVDGMIHVSLHPLIRDWIILRSGFPAHETVAFTTATMVLGHTLFSFRRGFDAFESFFEIDQPLRGELVSHYKAWDIHRGNNWSMEIWQILAQGTHLVPIPACWVFFEFWFYVFGDPRTGESGCRWAWQHCRSTEQPWPTVRCLAGVRWSAMLSFFHSSGSATINEDKKLQAILVAREVVSIAEKYHCGSIMEFARDALAGSLAARLDPTCIREAQGIYEDLVNSASVPKRKYRFLGHWIALLKKNGRSADIAKAEQLALAIYEESESCGDEAPDYRLRHWSYVLHFEILQCSRIQGQGAEEMLARELCWRAENTHVDTHYHHVAKLYLGMALLRSGKYNEAVAMFEHCKSVLETRYNPSSGTTELMDAKLCLSRAYLATNRAAEAIPLLLDVIKDRLEFLRNLRVEDEGFSLDAMRLLSRAYRGLNDRGGGLFAAHWLLELVESPDTKKFFTPYGRVEAHYSAAAAKGWLFDERTKDIRSVMAIKPNQATEVAVNEVCGHLDEAIEVLLMTLHRQRLLEVESDVVAVQKQLDLAMTDETIGEVRERQSRHTLFELHIFKALHLATNGFSTRAVDSLEASKKSLRVYSEVDVKKTSRYLETVWDTLAWIQAADDNTELVRETIAWTCDQARRLLGDTDETKQFVRSRIKRRGLLLVKLLPDGEPFTNGLYEEYQAAQAWQPRQPPSQTQCIGIETSSMSALQSQQSASLPQSSETLRKSDVKAKIRGFFRRGDSGSSTKPP